MITHKEEPNPDEEPDYYPDKSDDGAHADDELDD